MKMMTKCVCVCVKIRTFENLIYRDSYLKCVSVFERWLHAKFYLQKRLQRIPHTHAVTYTNLMVEWVCCCVCHVAGFRVGIFLFNYLKFCCFTLIFCIFGLVSHQKFMCICSCLWVLSCKTIKYCISFLEKHILMFYCSFSAFNI